MKKLYSYFIPAFILTANMNVQSQPVLNGSNVNPINGTSIVTHPYNYSALTPGAGGANITWNYASIGNTGNFNADFVAPSSTPYAAQFPNANTAFYYPSFGAYQFFLCNATEYSHCGDVASGTIIPFSDREELFTFPCTYNSSGSDYFYGTFTSGGYTYFRYGTTSFLADGYGTLIMPYGTITNVLRIKFIEDYVDSTNVLGTPVVITYHNDQYMWMKPGTHAFLLEYYTITGGGNTTTAGYYLDQANVGIHENEIENLSYSIFPNPATDFIHVNYEIKNKSKIEIRLLNSIGQCVKTILSEENFPGMYMKEISLTGFKKGIYTLQLLTEEYQENKKIILN